MKKLTASQTKSITKAKDQVSAAANVMIETPLELIKCILLKHETAVIEVMKELHEEKMELKQQRDELQAKWDHFQRLCQDHGAHGIGDLIVQRDEYKKDAERYRWLRDYRGYSYGMGSDTPAECGISFEFVQSNPEESTMTIDAAIDAAMKEQK